MNKENYILMSINNQYFQDILEGKKLYEYRTRFTSYKTKAFIYLPGPDKKIAGLIDFDYPIKGSPEEIGDFYEKYDNGNKEEMLSWLGEKDAFAIPILKITLFKPLGLERLKEKFPQFSPPQSYYYLD